MTRSPLQRDARWMARALELARRGEGLTRPNPPVGAVCISRAGRLVGEAYHRRAGTPHAEALALEAAGARARGGSLYVTLEPCCTWGRTPPCTEAILASGVKEVVVAVRDPNPLHAGRGLRVLRRAGLTVRTGVLATEVEPLVQPFASWVTRGRPWVTLKMALSLDGRTADRRGRARWVSSSESRDAVQALRRRVDAVLVGAGTVRLDDPSLTPRPARGRSPWRVVATGCGNLPPSARILSDPHADRTLVATTSRCSAAQRARLARRGAEVVILQAARGQPSIPRLLRALGQRGVLHLLCEGGAQLAASLVRAGVVDEYLFFISPCLLGGDARAVLAGPGWLMRRRPRLRFEEVRRCGPDVCLRARPIKEDELRCSPG